MISIGSASLAAAQNTHLSYVLLASAFARHFVRVPEEQGRSGHSRIALPVLSMADPRRVWGP
jgi:hypothetical protein